MTPEQLDHIEDSARARLEHNPKWHALVPASDLLWLIERFRALQKVNKEALFWGGGLVYPYSTAAVFRESLLRTHPVLSRLRAELAQCSNTTPEELLAGELAELEQSRMVLGELIGQDGDG